MKSTTDITDDTDQRASRSRSVSAKQPSFHDIFSIRVIRDIRGSSLAAYSLIEVLVASAILMIAVTAAAALALATVTQEEINTRVARCINLHEQAVRLYQLGLGNTTIAAILPRDPAVLDYPDFSAPASVSITGLGTVEQVNSTLTFTTSDAAGSQRTSTITAIRPSIR